MSTFTKKIKLFLIAIIVIGLAIGGMYLSHLYGKKHPSEDFIKKVTQDAEQRILDEQKELIDGYEAKIKELETDLKQSKVRYNRLKNLIDQKAKEADAIKLPQTSNEIKKRLKDLGYETVQ